MRSPASSTFARGPRLSVRLLEPDGALRRRVAAVLESRGHRVDADPPAAEGPPVAGGTGADVLLVGLPPAEDARGELLRGLSTGGRPWVALVEPGDVTSALEAGRRGARACLEKPLAAADLLGAVEDAVRDVRDRSGGRRSRSGREGPGTPDPEASSLERASPGPDTWLDAGPERLGAPILGRSPAIRRTLELVRMVAPTRSSVLITGETGTGKELVARAIHELSPRAEGPFVPVVCSALPESLLEGELFGHRKGSFTGAHRDRKGLVERAEGGTLFLDEVSTVSLDAQVKLLRVLEERRVRPVGGGPSVPVDFRLLAASNRPLEEEVEEGRFRQDLYYRLNVFPIRVPPLRERIEDLPELVEHFRRRFAEENGLTPREIRPETLARMAEHRWPGNVRELEHWVERAMILHQGRQAVRFDPPPEMLPDREAALLERAEGEGWDLDRLEREYVLRVLEEAGGNRSRAAEILGVHRRTVTRKIRRWRPRTRGERVRDGGSHGQDAGGAGGSGAQGG